MLRLAAIGIDLDSLACYRAIHGLPARDGEPDPVLELGLERCGNLLADLGLRATFFAVGADLPATGAALKRLAAEGHEVASHSFAHDYALAALPAVEIAADLCAAHDALATLLGRAPRGFRAPGYSLSPPLLAALADLGYEYDSSLFPCPLYGSTKNLARRWYRLRGRESQSLPARWRELCGPRRPYRARPASYWQPLRPGEPGLLELPIGVAPGSGLPLLGTAINLLPPSLVRGLLVAPILARLPLANLELHGIDLVAGDDPGVEPALRAAQPDLRVPLGRRLERLAAVLRRLAAAREVVTLAEAAARFAAELG